MADGQKQHGLRPGRLPFKAGEQTLINYTLGLQKRPQTVCFGNVHKPDPSCNSSLLYNWHWRIDTGRAWRSLWFLQLQKVKPCDQTPNAAWEDRNVRGATLVSLFLLYSTILLRYRHAEMCSQAPALIHPNKQTIGASPGGSSVNEARRWRQLRVYVSDQKEWRRGSGHL